MSAFPKIERLIVVPSGGWVLLLTDSDGTAVTITIAAGEYYMTTTADGGTRSFLAEVKLRLDNGAGVTYTVTIDDDGDSATGRVTITPSAGTVTIVWDGTSSTSTALRNTLGFTANVTASAAATGTNQAKSLWLPNSARTPDEPDPAAVGDPFGKEDTDYVAAVAPSGAYSPAVFNTRNSARLRFDNILGLKAFKAHEASGYVNGSLQTWYRDLMDAGAPPFRYYPDRASEALYHTLFLDAEQGHQLRIITAGPTGWVGARALFSVEFLVGQYVHVSA